MNVCVCVCLPYSTPSGVNSVLRREQGTLLCPFGAELIFADCLPTPLHSCFTTLQVHQESEDLSSTRPACYNYDFLYHHFGYLEFDWIIKQCLIAAFE